MKKIFFIVCALFIFMQINAQHFKLSLTQGIAFDFNKANDSLFFAKNYASTQLRIGYHVGKLGLIANVTNIRQKSIPGKNAEDKRFPDFAKQSEKSFSDVNTLNTNLGLELCVPVIKRKAQFNFYATYGFSFSNSDSSSFKFNGETIYNHKANNKITGCYQAGLSFNYKFNSHFAMKWQNEFDSYKLSFDAIDTRKNPSQFSGLQPKKLIISSLGVQYTF